MTFVDMTPAPSGTWGATGASAMTWAAASGASASGNYGRMVQSRDYVASGQGGVDFPVAFTDLNPWAITAACPASIVSTHRNEPT